MTKLYHRDLSDLGEVLGYKGMKEGICRGFSCMWAQAVLAQDEKAFHDRLDLMGFYKQDFGKLKKDIKKVKQKVRLNLCRTSPVLS